MPLWMLVCPYCATENEAKREDLRVDCGLIACTCTCLNCGREFEAQQEYWRWLGLDQGSSLEPREAPGATS